MVQSQVLTYLLIDKPINSVYKTYMTIQKLWTCEELTALGLGNRVTLWKYVRDGVFPKPVKLGGTSNSPNRWLDEDIKNYFKELQRRTTR